MDEQTKIVIKNEITILKGIIPAAVSATGTMQNATFPVTGPVVNIPAIPMAAQAIKAQNDSLLKIVNLLEKIVDAS